MAAFKPAYLIHGDDHGRISERRARLRALAEAESGLGGVEVLEGEASTPEAAANALCAMSLTGGRRFVIVEGVERWREGDLAPLERVLADPVPDTTAAFFAYEEGRAKAPQRLHDAVTAAGGTVHAESTLKPKELPRWVVGEAGRLGLELDVSAARALVHRVGDRQQRLVRELERLALELGPGARIDADQVEELACGSAEHKVWSLADAVVARDRPAALARYLELRDQGERLPSLVYSMTRRLRDAHDAVARLEAGESPADVKRGLRMPSWAASEFLQRAQRSDSQRLRAAIERLADLEVETRGGGTLAEDTAAVRAIAAVSG